MKKKLLVFIEDNGQVPIGGLSQALIEAREKILSEGRLDELSVLRGSFDFVEKELPRVRVPEGGFSVVLMEPGSYDDNEKRRHLGFLGALITQKFDARDLKEGAEQFNRIVEDFLSVLQKEVLAE